jgi:hypothetical protein
MGRLVRHAKIGQVNWQCTGGGPEMAAVNKACCKLHLQHLASSYKVPFCTSDFTAWSQRKFEEKQVASWKQ